MAATAPTPDAPKPPKRVAFSGIEVMFWDEMKKIGADVEAYIQRPAQEWAPSVYGYKITLKDGRVLTGLIPWNIETFSRILAIAKEGTAS
ncbi:MAG: hypothetical protein E6Q97_24735 [Desulfurellales bacterium]|nr:MAG: hypothetical protein E6Q97_24735 [Desulfurellales bacterium]